VNRLLRRRRGPADAGMTLVEFLVAGAVMTVVLAGVGAVFAASMRASRQVGVQTATSADVRIGLESITRSLRVTDAPAGEESAFVRADTNVVNFYTLLNRSGAAQTTDVVPTQVDFSWNGTCLIEGRTPGTLRGSPGPNGERFQWPAAGRTTRCLLRTATAPQFQYYTTGALTVSGTPVAPLTVPAGGLTLDDRKTIRSVQVTVTATAASDVPAQSARSRVTLTNV
jgi:Tfp pilus assembly protein PilW